MKDFYNKNLNILKPYFTASLYKALSKDFRPKITYNTDKEDQYIYIDSQEIDVEVAMKSATTLAEAYLEEPQQIFFGDNIFDERKNYELKIPNKNIAEVQMREIQSTQFDGISNLKAHKKDLSAAFLVFGIDTGLFLEKIYCAVNAIDIIIFENNIDNLKISLCLFDWSNIISDLTRRKGKIYFIFTDKANGIITFLEPIFQKRNFPFIDGIYKIMPQKTKFMESLFQDFLKEQTRLLSYNGWLEDEFKHLYNIQENYIDPHKIGLNLQKNKSLEHYTVAIIGSGPSIDKQLPLLKMVREHFIIFSCGSALRVLLKNNIKPDFHCELENVDDIIYEFNDLSKNYSLKDITFLASTTSNAKLSSFFDETYYIFRSGNAITELMAYPHKASLFCSHSVSIMATDICINLGFRNIVLIGIDFAYSKYGLHHSKLTSYNYADEQKLSDASVMRVKGNKYPFVATNTNWLFMLRGLESLLTYYEKDEVIVHNVNEGAYIDKTKPSSLEYIIPSINEISDKATIKKQILRENKKFALSSINYEKLLIATNTKILNFLDIIYNMDTKK